MKAQRRFGLSAAWLRVTAVFGLCVTLLIVGSRSPEDWQGPHRVAFWVGVGLCVLVSVAALVTYRGVTLSQRIARWLRPGPALGAGCEPAVDHRRRFGRQDIGVRAAGDQLVSVLAAQSPVSLQTVAEGLRQFDIRLDGVDVVSVERPGGPRRTWLVVRMDPARAIAAVAVRDSLASAMTAAVERIAVRLDARPLGAAEIAEVDAELLGGLEPTARRPKDLRGLATSFWLTPADITTETLDLLRRDDVDATVVTVRVTPVRAGAPRICAWVRHHSGEPLPAEAAAGLNRLAGRQVAAVRASLPVPGAQRALRLPARALPDDEPIVVGVP